MKIKIIAVGKLKEEYLRNEIEKICKAIKKRVEFEIVEVQDEKTPDRASEKEERIIRNKEAKRIISKIPDKAHVITLEIEGKPVNNDDFRKKLIEFEDGEIIIIIGGSLGLSDEVCKKSHFKMSFSRMTFPHQLIRLILVSEIEKAVNTSCMH